MRKYKCCLLLTAGLILTSCSNTAKSEYKTESIHQKATLNMLTANSESIYSNTYANLKITEDFTLLIPNASEMKRFLLKQGDYVSADELQKIFHSSLTQYFSDLYSESELESLANEAEQTDTMIFLENSDMGLTLIQPGYVHAYNRGAAMAIDPSPMPANIYFPAAAHDILQIYDMDALYSEDTWMLTDGNLSVIDAVKLAETLLATSSELKPLIRNLNVVSLTDTINVYCMAVTLQYGGIPFDIADISPSAVSFESVSLASENEQKSYVNLPGTIVISDNQNIDFQIGICTDYTIEVQETAFECITPESAIQIASEYLTEGVMFEADKMELIYAPYTISSANEPIRQQVDPVWKIRLFNSNDNMYYALYIDALNGECNCYKYTKESE